MVSVFASRTVELYGIKEKQLNMTKIEIVLRENYIYGERV